jgi:hypothetical protein
MNNSTLNSIYDSPVIENIYEKLEITNRNHKPTYNNYEDLKAFNLTKPNKLKKFINSILNDKRKLILCACLIIGLILFTIIGIIFGILHNQGILSQTQPPKQFENSNQTTMIQTTAITSINPCSPNPCAHPNVCIPFGEGFVCNSNMLLK